MAALEQINENKHSRYIAGTMLRWLQCEAVNTHRTMLRMVNFECMTRTLVVIRIQ